MAHVTGDIFAHNAYCDKKIISSHMFQLPTKVSSEKHALIYFCFYTLIFCFVKSLLWPIDIHGQKKNIFLAILCAEMSYVTWA